MRRTIIVSADKNWLIGKGNGLPWKISEDMQWFKTTTMGCPVVMGRKTWESLYKKPLPGRANVVVTRTIPTVKTVETAYTDSVEMGLNVARYYSGIEELGPVPSDIFIIGGATIYKYCLDNNLVDRMLISRMKGEYEGDVFFPKFDESKWKKTTIREFKDFDVIEYVPNN